MRGDCLNTFSASTIQGRLPAMVFNRTQDNCNRRETVPDHKPTRLEEESAPEEPWRNAHDPCHVRIPYRPKERRCASPRLRERKEESAPQGRTEDSLETDPRFPPLPQFSARCQRTTGNSISGFSQTQPIRAGHCFIPCSP